MALKIVIITLAVLQMQVITGQYLSNIGPAFLPNSGLSTISLGASGPISVAPTAVAAAVSAPISVAPAVASISAPSLAAPAAIAAPVSFGSAPVSLGSTISGPVPLAGPAQLSSIAGPAQLSLAGPALLPNAATLGSPFNAGFTSPASINAVNSISTGVPSVFAVTSTSPIAPLGISVFADSIYLEGPLAVSGQLPYLGTVGLEGSLASSGQGVSSCGCGNGNVAIVSEGLGGLGVPGVVPSGFY